MKLSVKSEMNQRIDFSVSSLVDKLREEYDLHLTAEFKENIIRLINQKEKLILSYNNKERRIELAKKAEKDDPYYLTIAKTRKKITDRELYIERFKSVMTWLNSIIEKEGL